MKNLMKYLSIFFMIVMVLGACAPQTPADPSLEEEVSIPDEVEEPEEEVDTPAEAQEPEEKDKYTIAVIRWDPNDIYFNGVQYGQELERDRIMEEEGVEIEFRVFGANDAAEQVNALQTYMDVGIDGAMIVPWQGTALTGSVEEFIPDAKSALVAFDNFGAGVIAGQYALERLNELKGEDWVSSEGVIIELRCIITISADIGRHEGYHSVFDPILESNPNLKWEVTEAFCDGGQARSFVDDMISRYGPENILAVLSIDGTMGIGGAVPAFDAQGMLYPPDDPNHIPVVTVDGTQVELEGINQGDMDFAAVQPAVGEGIMAMRVLWDMIKEGKQFEKPDAESVFVDGDAYWMPVEIVPGEGFDGPWYKLQTYGIPVDAPVDDQNNWANLMYYIENGEYPEYSGPWGK